MKKAAAKTPRKRAPRKKKVYPEIDALLLLASKCGYVPPNLTEWHDIDWEEYEEDPDRYRINGREVTRAERVLGFAKTFLVVPEGPLQGQPLILDDYQSFFVYAVFDAPAAVRKAILSVARRNGKTLVVGAILWSFICGPEAHVNSVVACAAMSKEQAKVAYRLMKLMAGPALEGHYRLIDSTGRIFGLSKNVELITLSREAKTGHGKSIKILLIDEAGQIEAQNDDYLDMLFTSQGSYEDAITFIISTQAPSDAAFLSTEIDSAEKHQPKDVVCHVHAAPNDCDITDQKAWFMANPGLGKYRSLKDMQSLVDSALRIPSKQSGVKNLNLNQRVTQFELAFAPEQWKAAGGQIDLDVIRNSEMVSCGIDLSQRTDLTAAVVAGLDPETDILHLKVFAFAPEEGLRERILRDKTPYDVWVDQGHLILCPGAVVSFEFVMGYLRQWESDESVSINKVVYDRWRIEEAKKEAERCGFATNAEWLELGQGMKDQTVAIERLEDRLLTGRLLHGNSPPLNAAAATAVVQYDAAGNRKIVKSDSTKRHTHRRRIDPLSAALSAVAPFSVEEVVDVSSWIA